MPAKPDEPPKSPFAGFDHPAEIRPDSAGIGQLAINIAQLCGTPSLLALACALRIDQGKGSEAMALLEMDLLARERLAAEAKAKKAAQR